MRKGEGRGVSINIGYGVKGAGLLRVKGELYLGRYFK